MADSRSTSATKATQSHRSREAKMDMMETDIDNNTSGSPHSVMRTDGTQGQLRTELGTGASEITFENAREFLDMVKKMSVIQPEIEKEFDALEMMVSRKACMTDVESKLRVQALERQLGELREENTQLKVSIDSRHGTYRRDGNIPLETENADGKLKATEILNHQLQEEVKKLKQQNRDVAQNLETCKAKLAFANDQIQNEQKAKEDSQNQERTMNELLNRYKTEYPRVKKERNELRLKVQESNQEIEALKQVKEQLTHMIEVKDSALQEKRKDLDLLHKELDQTKSRLSKMMGNQMKDGNPYIADLSDKNRPTKVADTYSELYDNEWTDAFDVLQNTAYRKEEKDIAKQLFDILMDIDSFCKQEAERQTDRIKQSLLVDDQGGKLPPSTHQELKQFQRSTADCSLQGVYQKYVDPNRRRSLSVTANASKVPEFVKKCIDVCWIMAVQDPPLEFKIESQHFESFNKDEYKAYTKLGPYIDYVVWPPLLLHKGGPLLAKGVAQGWYTQQGGMNSPGAKNKETSFPKESKQDWSTTTHQTGSYPSANTTYAQSPIVPTTSYPASTVTYTQYQQTTVAPSYGTSFSRAYSQPLTTPASSVAAPSQHTTDPRVQLVDVLQSISGYQNTNANGSYPRHTDWFSRENVTQHNNDSQMAYGIQNGQSRASPYGNTYNIQPHMYPKNQ